MTTSLKVHMKIASLFLIFLTTSIDTSAQDPLKVDPSHYRILFENAHIRVLEYRDKPGDKAPMHSHPSYMTYVAGPGKTELTLPDGRTLVGEEKGSIFECLPPTQHAMENVGTTDTQEVLIEFKDSTAPCSGTQREARVSSEPGSAASSKDVLTLKKLEQDWLDAYREGDADKMGRILADDFIGRWGDGR